MSGKIVISGVAALVAGVVMLGLSFASPREASAGLTQIPCNATATATPDQIGVISFQQLTVTATDTPVPTCTPVRLKTHTPTNTPTEAPTQTPVPVTPEPTKPAPTATQPGGGAGGQQVLPPDTGTGATAGRGGIELPFLAAGMLLLVLGGGSILLGARRRG